MRCPACGVEIRKKLTERQRSNPQNRYLHGVLLPILSDHTGYDEHELKGVIKWRFGIKSTAELTTVEFENFLANVRRWASAELSVYLPEPNEQLTGELCKS